MTVTRRTLIVLSGTFALAGCAQLVPQEGTSPLARARGPVDVGPATEYSAPGVYARFRTSHGFFIIRRGDQLFVESAICTHRNCLLEANADGFECPCHGSTFTLEGRVTRGPARRNLPRLAVERREDGHLIVHPDQPVSATAPQSVLTMS